ncbi:type II secretion system protein GspL [Pseudomonas sp. BNK-15]|uniref:type II secretion system protein GspL n=1 Tax=Pseudomonas sp. BNK-15 TaxID=3376152 RepID=UPI0039BF884A
MAGLIRLAKHCAARWGSQQQLYQARWRASRARYWLSAWRAELLGMLPQAVAARLGNGNTPQVLPWPLPADCQHSQPAVLLLPASHVLTQHIELPVAATRNLMQVLAYEIDRYTPYTADQVHFVARVAQRRAPQAQVELVAIARSTLDTLLVACGEQGVHLVGIDALDTRGERLMIDLLPAESARTRSRPGQLGRWLWLGHATCCVMLGAAWLERRQGEVQAMQREVAAQREAAQQVQHLRQALDTTLGASTYLASLKAQRPTVTALLADLTACVGDDTWIEQLEVSDGTQVTLTGQSERTSALLAQVKTCTTLEHAQFKGIIQADKTTGRERFSITAQLSQEVPHAPAH